MRNLYDTDLDLAERCAARRQYRILRIAMYGDIEYTGWDRPAYQGCYGLDRDEAKKRIAADLSARLGGDEFILLLPDKPIEPIPK